MAKTDKPGADKAPGTTDKADVTQPTTAQAAQDGDKADAGADSADKADASQDGADVADMAVVEPVSEGPTLEDRVADLETRLKSLEMRARHFL